MFCSNCGQKIDADSHFCIYCGHEVKGRKPQPTTPDSKQEAQQPSKEPKQSDMQNRVNDEEQSATEAPVPESNQSSQGPKENGAQNSGKNEDQSAAPDPNQGDRQQGESLEQSNENDEEQPSVHNGSSDEADRPTDQNQIHTTSVYEDMMIYVGKKSQFYDQKWRKMDQTSSKNSWNFASFFLTFFWLGYRRLFKELFIIMGLFFVVEFVFLFSHWDITYLQYANFVLGLGVAVILGLFSNNLYRRQVEKKVTIFRNVAGSQDEKEMLLRGKGGTSTGGLFGAIGIYAIYFLIMMYLVVSIFIPVLQIKGGNLDAYPDITVGEAFDDFFDKGNWDSKKSKASFKEVEFTGTKKFEGEKHDVKINIIIDSDNKFQFDRIIVDGDELNNVDTNMFVEFIFDDSEGLEYW